MKKIAILTSVLALAACGGGSGGGHGGIPSETVKPSNLSSIDIAELENVDFSGGDSTYNFVVENGVVTKIESGDKEYIIDGNSYAHTSEYNGIKETEIGTIEMLGRVAKLKYSDFGYMQRHGYQADEEFHPDGDANIIAGGIQKYEVTTPTNEMIFTGTAVAALTATSDTAGEAPTAMISKTNDAVLTFDGTREHLIMNFSKADNPWYDVVIDGTVVTISTDDETKIDSNFHMSQPGFDLTDAGHCQKTTYYGADNNPTEVISTAKFNGDGVWVETAFGGTLSK